MTGPDVAWGVGAFTLKPAARFFARVHHHGADRIPAHGGVVLALNHLSWFDVAGFGSVVPRTVWYLAKAEAHQVPVLGQIMRTFGSFAVRRGESDRDAVRLMKEVVREGRVLGLFVEGTRQKSGVPGRAQAGAGMIAVQEEVPVVPGAIHGSQSWCLGNFQPVTVAFGEPVRFGGLPRNGRGYREASVEIEARIRRLWEFAVDLHQLGRPRVAIPPRG